MSDAVLLNIKGVKCDADGCDYRDDSATPSEAFVGRTCPKCGATLLTAEDWAAIQLIKAAVNWVNVTNGPIEDGTERLTIPIGMDGSGTITFPDGGEA